MDRLTYDIYFGDTKNPPLVLTDSLTPLYDPPGDLDEGKSYYWRVVVRDMWGIETVGPLWRFTTFLPTPFSVFTKDVLGLDTKAVLMLADFEHFMAPELYDSVVGTTSYSSVFKNPDGTCKWEGIPFEAFFNWWYTKYMALKTTPTQLMDIEVDTTKFITSYYVLDQTSILGTFGTLPVYKKEYHPFYPFVLNGTLDSDYCPIDGSVLVLTNDGIVEYKLCHHWFEVYTISEDPILITSGECLSLETSLFRSAWKTPGGYVAKVLMRNVSPVDKRLSKATVKKIYDDPCPLAEKVKFGDSSTTCLNNFIEFLEFPIEPNDYVEFYVCVDIPEDLEGAFGVSIDVTYDLL